MEVLIVLLAGIVIIGVVAISDISRGQTNKYRGNSPGGTYVRGHYRKTKSGKVTYVRSYRRR